MSDCFYIWHVNYYKIAGVCEPRWAQSDYWCPPPPPPGWRKTLMWGLMLFLLLFTDRERPWCETWCSFCCYLQIEKDPNHANVRLDALFVITFRSRKTLMWDLMLFLLLGKKFQRKLVLSDIHGVDYCEFIVSHRIAPSIWLEINLLIVHPLLWSIHLLRYTAVGYVCQCIYCMKKYNQDFLYKL